MKCAMIMENTQQKQDKPVGRHVEFVELVIKKYWFLTDPFDNMIQYYLNFHKIKCLELFSREKEEM